MDLSLQARHASRLSLVQTQFRSLHMISAPSSRHYPSTSIFSGSEQDAHCLGSRPALHSRQEGWQAIGVI